MEKLTTPRVTTVTPIGQITVQSDVGEHPKWYEAAVICDKTHEAYAKTWWVPSGELEGRQLADMAHWIAGTLLNTVMMSRSIVAEATG